MNRPTQIFQRSYSEGRPFVLVRIVLVNPLSERITSFEERCWVDTGFAGGIHVPDFRRSEATMIGISPDLTTLMVAGGVRLPGYVCLAYLQQIENYTLPAPGLEIELIMQGRQTYGLMGLDVLRNWITKFNGPAQLFGFYE